MAFEITTTEVWVGEIEDRPGALADKLEAVMRAGANLDFVIARPIGEKRGAGVLYIAPLHGAEQIKAAEDVGLRKSQTRVLRIAGPDRPGLGAGIARTLAEAGINIRGLSAAAQGERALFYVRLDVEEDVVRAAQLLTPKLG